MALIHEGYTQVLRGCFFDVQNEVGLGRQEAAYHEGCRLWIAEHSVPVASKPPHRLLLNNEVAHTLFPDFVGWDCISLEIKAVPRKLALSEWVQVRDYMKCRGDTLGLLVNFGLDRVHVERIAVTSEATALVENWEHWAGNITGPDRDLGIAVRDVLRAIYAAHSTGYGQDVVDKLVTFGLTQRGLGFVVNPVAKSYFHQTVVDESPLEFLLIENRLALVQAALFDSNEFNISRGLSFMKTLGIPWGIAINWGRSQAEFTALRYKSNSQ